MGKGMVSVRDCLVDSQAFYDDIRSAETDRERADVLMHYQVSHLDSGYEPEQVDEDWYREEIAAGVEDEIGLDVPDIEILRYENPGQLIYDGMTADIPIPDVLGKEARYLVPDDDATVPSRAWNNIVLQLQMVPNRMLMTQMSEQVSGMTHVSDDKISYAAPNIQDRADRIGQAYDDVRNAVLEHETLHAVQLSAYTDLMDARTGIIEDITDAADDPAAYIGETLQEASPEQLIDDPGTLIHNLNPLALPEMTLIEGHAEFYTDRIADTDIREKGEMDALDGVSGTLQRFTPMGSKTAQYRDGKKFFETLHDRGGNEYVHYTMQHPPDSMYAIRNPDRWADHVEKQLS